MGAVTPTRGTVLKGSSIREIEKKRVDRREDITKERQAPKRGQNTLPLPLHSDSLTPLPFGPQSTFLSSLRILMLSLVVMRIPGQVFLGLLCKELKFSTTQVSTRNEGVLSGVRP